MNYVGCSRVDFDIESLDNLKFSFIIFLLYNIVVVENYNHLYMIFFLIYRIVYKQSGENETESGNAIQTMRFASLD